MAEIFFNRILWFCFKCLPFFPFIKNKSQSIKVFFLGELNLRGLGLVGLFFEGEDWVFSFGFFCVFSPGYFALWLYLLVLKYLSLCHQFHHNPIIFITFWFSWKILVCVYKVGTGGFILKGYFVWFGLVLLL